MLRGFKPRASFTSEQLRLVNDCFEIPFSGRLKGKYRASAKRLIKKHGLFELRYPHGSPGLGATFKLLWFFGLYPQEHEISLSTSIVPRHRKAVLKLPHALSGKEERWKYKAFFGCFVDAILKKTILPEHYKLLPMLGTIAQTKDGLQVNLLKFEKGFQVIDVKWDAQRAALGSLAEKQFAKKYGFSPDLAEKAICEFRNDLWVVVEKYGLVDNKGRYLQYFHAIVKGVDKKTGRLLIMPVMDNA